MGRHACRVIGLFVAGVSLCGAQESPSTQVLIEAIERDDVDAIKKIIRDGVDVNAIHGESRTALTVAALSGHEDVVTALLAQWADPNDGALGVAVMSVHGSAPASSWRPTERPAP
jgi:hypothetical protein